MDIERRTASNTAIVLVDYVTGFANMIGSQELAENTAGALALAQTAVGFDVPLVVTLGPEQDPRGGLYPAVQEVVGDHPIVYRGGSFDAFDFAGFGEAVERTGARHLVVAGLMTDGCVLQTCLTALRRDYSLSLVVDATAACTTVAHDTAVDRLVGLGVTAVTWMSLAAELQVTYDNPATLPAFRRIQANSPQYAMMQATLASSRAAAAPRLVATS